MELLPVKQEPPLFGPQRASYKLETRDLSYKLCMKFGDFNWFCCCKNNVEDKLILKNVNCEAMPREITAIAGPSGAGKTTLLEILAGMILPGRVLGQVLVNNQPIDAKRFRRLSGYVPQDDALFPLLTVQEMLMYSALLRLPGGNEEARVSVAKVMKELGLEQIANSRIGQGSSCGISGGERRRVSIGVDLVHDPAVVLIDEPTSGLDSASSLQVVMLLKSIAVNQGKTIVLTIHQPGFRILELFSRLILLSNGLVKHNGSLSSLGERLRLAGHHIPRCVNVLEFSIDVIDSLNGYSPYKTNEENLLIKAGAYSNPYQDKVMLIPNSVGKEIGILGQRFFRNIFRTKQLFLTRVIQALLTGLILGTIFMDVGSETGQVALQTQIGFFAFSLTFLLSSTTEGLPIFLQERRILMRETSRGAYRVSSYVLSNTLVYLPFLLLITLIFSTSVYWLIGLKREIYGFLYFSLVVWVVVLMSDSFVACFSALVPNFIMGSSVIAGLMGSFFLFSGYFISKENIPKYWIFMHYLSLFKYPFECFLINEYGGEEANRRCLDFENGICNLYGSGFLKQQGLMESKKWSNLVVMLGFVLGYRVICFLILWYRCYRSR